MELEEIKCEAFKKKRFFYCFFFCFLNFGFQLKAKIKRQSSNIPKPLHTIKSLYLDEYRSHEQTISLSRRKKMIITAPKTNQEAFLFLLSNSL
jgi:hypothetical protein